MLRKTIVTDNYTSLLWKRLQNTDKEILSHAVICDVMQIHTGGEQSYSGRTGGIMESVLPDWAGFRPIGPLFDKVGLVDDIWADSDNIWRVLKILQKQYYKH